MEKEYTLREKAKGCEVKDCQEIITIKWGDWDVCSSHHGELTDTTTLKKVSFYCAL